jgi:hypothetical protein
MIRNKACGDYRESGARFSIMLHTKYKLLQARLKQLAQSQKLPEGMPFIELLPATPLQLLRQYPQIAGRVFSEKNLPVTSPLNVHAVAFVRGRMSLRGPGASAAISNSSQGVTMQGQPCMHVVYTFVLCQMAVTTAMAFKTQASCYFLCMGLCVRCRNAANSSDAGIAEQWQW